MKPIKVISIRAGLLATLIGSIAIPTIASIKRNQEEKHVNCTLDHKPLQKSERVEKK